VKSNCGGRGRGKGGKEMLTWLTSVFENRRVMHLLERSDGQGLLEKIVLDSCLRNSG